MPAEMVADGSLVLDISLSKMMDEMIASVDFLCGSNFGEGHPEAEKGVKIESTDDFYANYSKMLGPLYEEYQFEKFIR